MEAASLKYTDKSKENLLIPLYAVLESFNSVLRQFSHLYQPNTCISTRAIRLVSDYKAIVLEQIIVSTEVQEPSLLSIIVEQK